MDENSNAMSFLVGFLVGAAVGAASALVLAPKSGKRRRRDIARDGRKIAHRASETVENLRDKTLDAYEDARELVG